MQGHGRAVDWWAFGVLIYEMLAGYPPFYEEDTAQTYQRILHGRFTFPSDFPVTVRDLVRKLLQVCDAGTEQVTTPLQAVCRRQELSIQQVRALWGKTSAG
jgi:serine/threonine protein kinase